MLPSQELLDSLASRIEDAYTLRQAVFRQGCSTSRVWCAAAVQLWRAHVANPDRVPLDAELFVAAQPISVPISDPWTEIAHPESARRYRSAVRQIVRQLRIELKREIAFADKCIMSGAKIEGIRGPKFRRLSALGSYIVARRAGRDDLAKRLAPAAALQHQSCPLYRTASLALIPEEFYPDESLSGEPEAQVSRSVASSAVTVHKKHSERRECEN